MSKINTQLVTTIIFNPLEISHVIHEQTKRALKERHANPINDKQRTVFSNDFEIIIEFIHHSEGESKKD